jgi:rod shape-determining protein MreB
VNFNIGIDIGSSMVRMAAYSRGPIFSESAALALRGENRALFAIGNDALTFRGRAPASIRIEYPLSGGNVVKDEYLTRWLTYLFETAQSSEIVSRPNVLIAVDPQMQPSAVRHLVALALDAGAALCSTVRADLAAALGAGRAILKGDALLNLDVGASAVTCTLACAGKVLLSQSLPFGISTVDDALLRILRLRHGLIVGEKTAEEIKIDLCAAGPGRRGVKEDITGYSPRTGFPATISLSGEEVLDATEMFVSLVCELVSSVVDLTPVERLPELNDLGISMTGGGAGRFGLDSYIADKVGIACHVAEDPANAKIRGLTRMIERPGAYKSLIDAPTRRIERKLPLTIAKGATK